MNNPHMQFAPVCIVLLIAFTLTAQDNFGLLSSSPRWNQLAKSTGLPLLVRESQPPGQVRILETVPDRVPTKRPGQLVLGGDVRLPPAIAPPSWKFQPWEVRMAASGKSTAELIRTVVDVASRGGTLLLRETAISPEVEQSLRGLAEWLNVNGEAIYGATYGPLQSLAFGRTTAKEKTIYLHVLDWPRGSLQLRGIRPKVSGVSLLAGGRNLKFSQDRDRLTIEIPEQAPDAHVSVVAIATERALREFEEPAPAPPKAVAPVRKAKVARDHIEFVRIPPGEFVMGSNRGENERPPHRVRITRAFEMGKYEVTQAQWEGVMGSNPSTFKSPDRPVDGVSWNDTGEFFKKLNARRDGYGYRLPTEAEWEYAARAGMTDDAVSELDAVAWYNGNSGGETHEVGQKQPNAFGVYDMFGNVWEWCQDWYDANYYMQSPPENPPGPAEGRLKVARGGSWYNYPRIGRPAGRSGPGPDIRGNHVGLRCVREPALGSGLRGLMREAVGRREIAGGSLLVIHKGETIFREAFGYADLETRRPFRVEDLCFIASLSKSVSATLAVILDERSVFSLDDAVEKWLPEFKGVLVQGRSEPAKPPLIWQLLSHRSGLPGNDDRGAVRMRSGPPPALADAVAGWAKAGLLAEPGARFAYGNAGYVTMSRIAEVATGRKYEALMKELLLDPLGMSDTTFRPSGEDLKGVPRRYRRTAEGLRPEAGSYPVPGPEEWVNPAGGLFSTLDDLGRFLSMHLRGGKAGGRQIVSAAHLARMYRPHPPEPGSGYGLGWNVGGSPAVRHLGGSGTFLWLDPEHDAAGVLLTQVPWEGKRNLTTRLMELLETAFPSAGPPSTGAGNKQPLP